MTRQQLRKLDRELRKYIDHLTDGMGRPERRDAMGLYLTGLLLDGERKSIEPLAARLVDKADEIDAMRQRLQQCVSVSRWAEAEVFRRIAKLVDAELPELAAFVIDDTGFAKKGKHSVGVARQYSGTLGRVDNCQVATSLHLAGERGSACIGVRLYLPKEWATDGERRRKAGVPDDIKFASKWELALDLLDQALAAGVRSHTVLADAGYGDTSDFRDALRARKLDYAVGVHHPTLVWRPGTTFEVPPKPSTKGPARRNPRATQGTPIAIGTLAKKLTYRAVTWRAGTRGKQRSRFAAVRIRTAHRHTSGAAPGPEEWLLCEWPAAEPAPTKYSLVSLPATTPLRDLVRIVKLRWRVERDYQDLKGEVGLDHFEGRTWLGFHHHAALCAAAHAFLALRRARFPRRPVPWTLPLVRRHLQQVLLCHLPACPLCRRPFGSKPATPQAPRGASRI
jgi:SRSO17 transposase